MITTLLQLQTAINDASVQRLILSADIGTQGLTSIPAGKMLVPNGFRLFKGVNTAISAAATSDAGTKTILTVADTTGIAAGETVTIRGSSVAGYDGDWQVDSIISGTSLKLNMAFSATATGQLLNYTGNTTGLTAAASADGGKNTLLTVGSTSHLRAGDVVQIRRSSVGAYNGQWTVLDVPSGTTVKVALTFSATATGSVFKSLYTAVSGAAASGPNTLFTVASSAGFVAGKAVVIRVKGLYSTTATVVAVPDATHVTLNVAFAGSGAGMLGVGFQFDGGLDAGREQVFENFTAGDIRGSFSASELYPEWWGLWPNHHDRAINAAVQTVGYSGSPGQVVSFAATDYNISAPIDIRESHVGLLGAGSGRSRIRAMDRWNPVWEDSYIFTYFTSTESPVTLPASHSALVWMGSISGPVQSWGTSISGLGLDGYYAMVANPTKYVSLISSTGYVEENSVIENVSLTNFSGFGIGFESMTGVSTVNGLTIRDFWITQAARRNSIPIYIPPHAGDCTICNGTIDTRVYQAATWDAGSPPSFVYDWPACGVVTAGAHTSINSMHIEGVGIAVYVMGNYAPSSVTVTNVDAWMMMDWDMVHVENTRRAGAPPSLAFQAARWNEVKSVSNATNASPIVVTATGHGLVTGSTGIKIAGVLGNTAANSTGPNHWTVTVIDENTFSLNGSTGNGAYTGGGSVTRAITNATNASPIVIEQAQHGLCTNSNGVVISGVLGNTAANGSWTVTVVDANHFSLNGSTGNGAYTAGSGTVTAQPPTAYSHFRRYSGLLVIANRVNEYYSGHAFNSSVIAQNCRSMGYCNYLVRDALYGQEFTSVGRGEYPNGDSAAFTVYQRGNGWVTPPGGYTYTPKAITGATNAAPIVITASNHGLVTGQHVMIQDVLGNTAANGIGWTITVIDANTFSLNGSAGNGAYTSGGRLCSPTARAITAGTPALSKAITGATNPAAQNITGATGAGVVIDLTVTAHGYPAGFTHGVTVAGVGGNTAANGVWSVENIGANTLRLTGSTGNGAYTSGGTITRPVAITSTAHGLITGCTVTITGVTGNTNANGTWVVTVLDANTFSLNGRTGNAAYISGGVFTSDVRLTCPAHQLGTVAGALAWGAVIEGVAGMLEANNKTWTVQIIDANNVHLVGAAFKSTYTSGGLLHHPNYRTGVFNSALPARDKTYFSGDLNVFSTPPKHVGPMF